MVAAEFHLPFSAAGSSAARHSVSTALYRSRASGLPCANRVERASVGSLAQPSNTTNTTMEFVADQNALRPGENRIVLFVDKAGAVGSDARTPGYYLRDIQIEPEDSK